MQEEVLIWAVGATRQDRLDFVKKLLDCCPLDENKGLQRLVENSRKRKKNANRNVSNRAKVDSTAPVRPQGLPASVSAPWWSNYGPNQIVSFDCEMVTLINPRPDEQPIRAAKVAVVRVADKKVIYQVFQRFQNN